MDDMTEEKSTLATVEEDFLALSPIVEMDESSIIEEDSFTKDKATLNLDISAENFGDRTSQPTTPPETLRVRLSSLQSELDELKEFTDLERQTYHYDCVPRDQVQSLEDMVTSLREKLDQLIQLNIEYQLELENNKDTESKLKSQLEKAWKLQNKSMTFIEEIKQKYVNESIKHDSMIQEVEILPPLTFLEKYEENAPQIKIYEEHMLNSLKIVETFVKKCLHDKKQFQNKVQDLQSEIVELNELTRTLNKNENMHEISIIQSNFSNLADKLANIDAELAEISLKLLESESKRIEAETTKDTAIKEIHALQSEMDNTQETLLSIINILHSSIDLLTDSFVIESGCVTQEDITSLERILNYREVHGIPNSLVILVKTLCKLKDELKLKHDKCCELQSNVLQLNDHLRSFEKEASDRQLELKWLEEQIRQIPLKLAELTNVLESKDGENLILKNDLEAVLEHVDKLSNKLLEAESKIHHLEDSLMESNCVKANLKNEISNLKDCITVDSTQNQILLALKSLEKIIKSWDEKSKVEDLIESLHKNEDVHIVVNLLMNEQNKTIFNEIAKTYKMKLLVHDEKIYEPDLKLACDSLHSENKQLRKEIDALDEVIRKRIINKVNDLEKLFYNFQHQNNVLEPTQDKYNGVKDFSMLNSYESQNGDVKLLKAYNESCNKFKKEINNLNKASKSDVPETTVYNFNEIENLIDSWSSSDISDFIHHISELLKKYCEGFQNPKLKDDTMHIFDNFVAKLTELFEINNKLYNSEHFSSNSVEDCENKQEKYKSKIDKLVKRKTFSDNKLCENYIENDEADQLKAIKQLMVLEITSLDKNECENSLVCDSVGNLFNKLMQIIIKKEHEMSNSIHDQQKIEFHNLEITIEKLNNKLKSQESWTIALESENEKLNTELSSLKSLNTLSNQKLQALSNDLKSKNFETKNMSREILELKTENDSLVSDLDTTKQLVNNYRSSISSLEEVIERLNDDNVNQSNTIKHLELQLNSCLEKQQKHLNQETYQPPKNDMTMNAKGDFNIDRVNQNGSSENSIEVLRGRPELVRDPNDLSTGFETRLSEILKKEISIIKEVLNKGESNIAIHELLSSCYEKINLLKDIIQTIGSKILAVEISHTNDIHSIQSALDYKTKEMSDLKLSVSKLYMGRFPIENKENESRVIDEVFDQSNITSIQKEIAVVKFECLGISDGLEDLQESTKAGQSIVQDISETFRNMIDEINKLTKLVSGLRKSVENEQEKTVVQKRKIDVLKKEKQALKEQNIGLENKVKDLIFNLSEIKRNIFSEIEISFPKDLSDGEKVVFLNQTLKRYSETEEVFYNVTENLRFFRYQCQLMLSYIQSIEYKLNFTTQQTEYLGKENTSLKEQLSNQHLEMNRYINLVISKTLIPLQDHNQALDVISHIFNEHKMLKENVLKLTSECKLKREKIIQQQKELRLLTEDKTSLKFELTKCEDSVRNLRSELRNHLKSQRRESIGIGLPVAKQGKVDTSVQTDWNCCKKLQKKNIEQKEHIDNLIAKLSKNEQHQRSLLTSNPYNKQVTYLESALDSAKEKIRRLSLQLKRQESHNQELLEVLKSNASCQQRLDEVNKEIEKLKNDGGSSK